MNRLLLLAPEIARDRLYAKAGAVPSFHIAPARQQHARDLITGSLLGSYNSATPAMAVGADGILYTPAANAPVIEYDAATRACLGQRLWLPVTNLRKYSEDIQTTIGTQDYTINNATLVRQSTSTPIQGLDQASKLALNTGANTGNSSEGTTFGSYLTLSATTVYTQSIFVRAAGSNILRLRSNVTGQVFDIPIAGPAPSPTGTITAFTVQPGYANGWSRISWTFTTTTGAPGARADHWTLKTDIANSSDGIWLTGAMFNLGPTLAPYVPTGALSASSTADVWSITGADFSRIWNLNAATMYADWYQTNTTSTADTFEIVNAIGGGTNISMRIGYDLGARRLRYFASINNFGSFPYAIEGAANFAIQGKAAFAYNLVNDAAVSENGAAVITDTSGTFVPAMDTIGIGSRLGTYLNGYIRELAIFRSRRPNSSLTAMTQ